MKLSYCNLFKVCQSCAPKTPFFDNASDYFKWATWSTSSNQIDIKFVVGVFLETAHPRKFESVVQKAISTYPSQQVDLSNCHKVQINNRYEDLLKLLENPCWHSLHNSIDSNTWTLYCHLLEWLVSQVFLRHVIQYIMVLFFKVEF